MAPQNQPMLIKYLWGLHALEGFFIVVPKTYGVFLHKYDTRHLLVPNKWQRKALRRGGDPCLPAWSRQSSQREGLQRSFSMSVRFGRHGESERHVTWGASGSKSLSGGKVQRQVWQGWDWLQGRMEVQQSGSECGLWSQCAAYYLCDLGKVSDHLLASFFSSIKWSNSFSWKENHEE